VTDDRRPVNPHRPIYVERVNAAIDYIERNLGEELTLEQIADVAHFSPFHFHRVFGLLVGETLNRFINRLRMERAATLLVQHPSRPITDIASSCGLHSPSSFSRSFRDKFGMSASEWRGGGHVSYEDAAGESLADLLANVGVPIAGYGIIGTRPNPSGNRLSWEIACGHLPPTTVEIVDVPDLEVAYVRHTGHYQGEADVFTDIFTRLMTWADAHGLVNDDSWVISIYHDNPGITDDEKLRVSACVNVPTETRAEGDIGRMRLAGGPCAVARFVLGDQDYGAAWFAVSCGWMPDSGYEPDDRLPFERYPVGAATTSAGTEVVDICIPVRPLRR
jgi:AraC family transcriptional regulator